MPNTELNIELSDEVEEALQNVDITTKTFF